MIDFKRTLSFIFIAFFLFVSICCERTKTRSIFYQGTDNIVFLGDPNISENDYFNSLLKGRTASLLSSKSEEYLKYYSKVADREFLLSERNCSIRFTKNIAENKNVKINLYTVVGNRTIDSVQFYRNISGDEFGSYNCLSYYNPATKNIWQIKFFMSKSTKGDVANIVSYTKRRITDEGRIKMDTIFYLDEYLDMQMEKYNLYY